MDVRSIAVFAVFFLFGLPQNARCQTAPTFIHQGSWGGNAQNEAVASRGGHSYCFLGMGANVKILQVDSAANPKEVGNYYLGDMASAIAVRDTVVYIVGRKKGLVTVNVNDVRNPVTLGQCSFGYMSEPAILLKGNYAFITGGYYGLFCVDITNPALPFSAVNKRIGYEIHGIDSSGSMLYGACADSGIRILSIENPANPIVLGAFKTRGRARDIKVSGNNAYVAEEDSGIEIIDVSNPASCSSRGYCRTVNKAWSLVLKGKWALIADYCSSFQIADVSDPAKPVLATGFSFPEYKYIQYISVLGDIAFATGSYNGLFAYDLTGLPSARQIGAYWATDMPEDVAVAGNYAYVADNGYGVHILDVSDPQHPFRCGTDKLTNHGRKVHVDGNRLYLATWQDYGLDIFNIANPLAPQKISASLITACLPEDMAIQGNYAYVACNGYGLTVWDLSDQSSPAQMGTCPNLGLAFRVAVKGTNAFVAAEDSGFHIIDVSDPSQPRKTYSHRIGTCEAVALHGDYAYVAALDSGVHVFDVKDPLHAKQVSLLPGSAMDIDFLDSFALVADWGSGLVVFNIADPLKPIRCASYALPGITTGVTVSSGRVYVADGESGLHIYSVKNSSGILSLGPAGAVNRNPFAVLRGNSLFLSCCRPFESVAVSVITASGRRIVDKKSVMTNSRGDGALSIGAVPSGVFGVVFKTPEKTSTCKIIKP